MGIVTWMQAKIEIKSRIDKVYFAPSDDLDSLNAFLYKVMPRRIGQEFVILNNVDFAAILADTREEFEELRKTLPKYTLAFIISGLIRRPEEKIAYEEHFLSDVIRHEYPDIRLTDGMPGFPQAADKLKQILRNPWPSEKTYWKAVPAGNYQDLFLMKSTSRSAVPSMPRMLESIRMSWPSCLPHG